VWSEKDPKLSGVEEYLGGIVALLCERLGGDLLSVALIGGGGAGSFEPASSDIDVAVVVARAPASELLLGLAGELSHSRRPVPARRLELVVYSREGEVLLNLNSGDDVERAEMGIDPAERFWFVLDVAIARGRSRTLFGEPLGAVLSEPPPGEVRAAALDSLRWFAREEPGAPDTLLNACRTWRWAVDGEWSTKEEAADWALPRVSDPAAIRAAVDARRSGRREGLDPGAVRRVAALAEEALLSSG
jgi:hypothetical protein